MGVVGPSGFFFADHSILLWIIFVIYASVYHCYAVSSVSWSIVITWGERPYLLAFVCVVFSCVFVTSPIGVPGQVGCLIVSIPDLCFPLLLYFVQIFKLCFTLSSIINLNWPANGDQFLGSNIFPSSLGHWRSSHCAVTHVCNKNSTIKRRSPNVVKWFWYHKELLLKERIRSLREQILSFKKKFPYWKGMQLKRITAWSGSLPLMCLTFSALWLRHCWILISLSTSMI